MNKTVFQFLTSFVVSYTIYAYFLQTPFFFSRSRLGYALMVWAILFIVLRFIRFQGKEVYAKRTARLGIGGTFLFINLVFAGWISGIPYTYILLPLQTVSIKPASEEAIKLITFRTEIAEDIGLNNFKEQEGWHSQGDGIVSTEGNQTELTWQGRPGQYVELRWTTCTDCGKVRIFWNASESEELDLSESGEGKSITVTHDYPPLIFHKLGNLIVLEISIFIFATMLYWSGNSILKVLPDKPWHNSGKEMPFEKILPIAGLAALTFVSYGLKLQPILFNDDWCFIYKLQFGIIEPSILRRPLLPILIRLFMKFLPLHSMVYTIHIVQVGILFLTSVLFFIWVTRLVEKKFGFAFLAAALFLVFPSDYTRLNFTMAGTHLAFLLMMLGMILMIDYVKSGKPYLMLITTVLIIIGLLMYEGQLGLVVFFPCMIILWFREHFSFKRLSGFAGYYFSISLFLVWKLVIQPKIFVDTKFSSLDFSPTELIARFLNTPRIMLGGFKFPYQDKSWLTTGNIWIIFLIMVCLAGIGWIIIHLSRRETPQNSLENLLSSNLYIFLAGTGLWIAGYFPLIFNYPPNLYGHLSRVNMFSIPGAVLMLLSVIYTIFLSMSEKEYPATRLTLMAGLVLIFVGAVIQVQIEEAYNTSWAETKTFYYALFDEVPNVKAGTQIVLSLKGYEEQRALIRPVLSSSWEAWCAFGLLYDRTDLRVNYQYEKMMVPDFSTLNVLTSVLEKEYLTPVQDSEKLLVLEYDNLTHRLVIKEEGIEFLEGIVPEKYAPFQQILPLEAPIEARKILR